MGSKIWKSFWVFQNYLWPIYDVCNIRYYVGATPWFCIADADMLKDAMVKQFDKFADRSVCCYWSLVIITDYFTL